MYADGLVQCGELKDDLKMMVMINRRRGLKFNANKTKVMVLNGEEGLECEVYVDWIYLEYVSEFKYFGCVLDKSGTDKAEYSRKVRNGRRVAGVIRSLVSTIDLQLECASLA